MLRNYARIYPFAIEWWSIRCLQSVNNANASTSNGAHQLDASIFISMARRATKRRIIELNLATVYFTKPQYA